MGIVVCLAMLLGLLQLNRAKPALVGNYAEPVVWSSLLLGLWNALWYGLQHLHQFWGLAAIFSGLFMILSAMIIASEKLPQHFLAKAGKRLIPFRIAVFLGLGASFLLYAITLIRLNLGLAIIS